MHAYLVLVRCGPRRAVQQSVRLHDRLLCNRTAGKHRGRRHSFPAGNCCNPLENGPAPAWYALSAVTSLTCRSGPAQRFCLSWWRRRRTPRTDGPEDRTTATTKKKAKRNTTGTKTRTPTRTLKMAAAPARQRHADARLPLRSEAPRNRRRPAQSRAPSQDPSREHSSAARQSVVRGSPQLWKALNATLRAASSVTQTQTIHPRLRRNMMRGWQLPVGRRIRPTARGGDRDANVQPSTTLNGPRMWRRPTRPMSIKRGGGGQTAVLRQDEERREKGREAGATRALRLGPWVCLSPSLPSLQRKGERDENQSKGNREPWTPDFLYCSPSNPKAVAPSCG
jgi:hypothetical protein